MPDQIVYRQVDVHVGDVIIEVVPIGDGVWQLGLREHSIPFKGTLDEAITACDAFAVKLAPIPAAKAAVAVEEAKVAAYVEQVRADYEATKDAEAIEATPVGG